MNRRDREERQKLLDEAYLDVKSRAGEAIEAIGEESPV